jgi:hypothetical protein
MPDASSQVLDFTNVKEGGGRFNKRHMPPGDYKAKIKAVEDSPSKKDNTPQWLFTIDVEGGGSYPYYCKLQENQLWKIRNLFVAAGLNVPKKRVKVDPSKVVGKTIGVTLEDDEYEGKMQSVVQATFPVSELEGANAGENDEDEEEDEEEEVDTSTEDEEDDEEEEEEPAPKKKAKKEKPAKKAKKAADVDDDELEELEIEDL